MIVKLDLLPDGRTAIRPEGVRKRSDFMAALREAGGRRDKTLAAYVCERDQTIRLIDALLARRFDPKCSAALEERLGDFEEVVARRRRGAGGLAKALRRRVEEAGGKLYEFQRKGVAFLAQRNRALLADEMGVGKTIQALMSMPRGAGCVVVCPAVVKGVWRDECEKWRPDFVPTVLNGRDSFRWPAPGEVVILNYDILPPHKKKGNAIIMDPEFGLPPMGLTVIADEAHMLKNPTTNRTRSFRAMSREALKSGGNVWLLTGTPMLGKPMELYAVLRAADLEIEAFGSFGNFRDLFRLKKGGYRGKVWVSEGVDPRVPGMLKRVCMRRRRADVLTDLPEKLRRDHIVEGIDRNTVSLCDEAIAALHEAGIELTESALDMDLSDQQQVMNCIAAARSALAAAKIPAAKALVEQYEANEEPVVVFSAHRAAIDMLAKRPGWATITGDTSGTRRAEIAKEFRAGKYKGLAATIASAGVGITLCGGEANAAHAVFIDADWTPALNQQAEDRLHRMGQTRGVMITRLVADHPLDRHVMRLLARKQELIQATMPVTHPQEDQ